MSEWRHDACFLVLHQTHLFIIFTFLIMLKTSNSSCFHDWVLKNENSLYRSVYITFTRTL